MHLCSSSECRYKLLQGPCSAGDIAFKAGSFEQAAVHYNAAGPAGWLPCLALFIATGQPWQAAAHLRRCAAASLGAHAEVQIIVASMSCQLSRLVLAVLAHESGRESRIDSLTFPEPTCWKDAQQEVRQPHACFDGCMACSCLYIQADLVSTRCCDASCIVVSACLCSASSANSHQICNGTQISANLHCAADSPDATGTAASPAQCSQKQGQPLVTGGWHGHDAVCRAL